MRYLRGVLLVGGVSLIATGVQGSGWFSWPGVLGSVALTVYLILEES